jgi:serpin B
MAAVSILLSLSVLGQFTMGKTPESVAPAVAQAGNQFAVDLYGQLSKEQLGKNLFFSPASLSIALAMTAAGARGPTEAEMAGVLHLGDGLPQAHAAYQKILERWNGDGKNRSYQLRVANRLWGQRGFSFLAGYLTLTRQQYGAELGLVDFSGQSEAARQEINAWIEKQTAEKIKDLIPQGQLDARTKLVLTNAVYFKGDWTSTFQAGQTRDADFTVTGQQKVTVPLMHQRQTHGYAEDTSLQVLELPYKGDELSMLVLLPKTPDGLPELERSLSARQIAALWAKLRQQQVDVYLPKFKLEASCSLSGALQALGMKLAFSDTEADFSAMDGQRDLYISAALHKAYVDVNEAGTEAAAATAIIMRTMSARMPGKPIPVFRADHPFLFLIGDKRDGSILFLGRMLNPKAAAN